HFCCRRSTSPLSPSSVLHPASSSPSSFLFFFFFNDTATPEIYTLSLHDALPISILMTNGTPFCSATWAIAEAAPESNGPDSIWRSEEHTSELQSLTNLVCRLLLEKKKKKKNSNKYTHTTNATVFTQPTATYTHHI